MSYNQIGLAYRLLLLFGMSGNKPTEGTTMDSAIRLQMLAECEAIDRAQAAILAEHPDSPRYCYDCQTWLDNQAAETGHAGHSIH